MPIAKVRTVTLDQCQAEPDLIKIDVEGYEMQVLRGAENTIQRCKPKLVIEVNREALSRQGTRPEEIFSFVAKHGYRWSIMQENCGTEDPMYDILCLPVEKQAPAHAFPGDPRATQKGKVHLHSDLAPQAFDFKAAIDQLAEYAKGSSLNKQLVMQRLVSSGLKKPRKKK